MALTGCQPFEREKRIELHPHTYDAASRPVKELIASGQVRRGMTREQVYLAMGVPETISREVGSREVAEEWMYERQSKANYVLMFRRGVLHHIRRDIQEEPSAGAAAALTRLLNELPLDDLEEMTRALAEFEGETGTVSGTLKRRISSGATVTLAEQRVTLLPRCAAWAEADGRIQEERKLRSGLAKYSALREVARNIESATPSELVLRMWTDEDAEFEFPEVPPGDWMLTAYINDEEGLHAWWVPVSVSGGSEVALTLNNDNLSTSYIVH